MLCITITHDGRHVNVVNGKAIGASKHIDYALFHFKAADVKLLKQPFTKFVFADAKGKVSEVIFAAPLKERGVNYKTAKREPVELTEAEQEEVSAAVKLAAEYIRDAAAPKANPATDSSTPAADIAKVFLTPAAVAVGLGELMQASGASAGSTTEDDAPTGETSVATVINKDQSAEAGADAGSEPEQAAVGARQVKKRRR